MSDVLSELLWTAVIENDAVKAQELVQSSQPLLTSIFLEPKEEVGASMLHYSAQFGRSNLLEIMANAGVDLQVSDAVGWQPIHHACRSGHLWTLNYLVAFKSIHVDARDSQGRTPLHWAVWGDHESLVDYLLQHSCNVNARDYEGGTPLHWASSLGRFPAVRRLVAAGAHTDLLVNSSTPTAWDMASKAAESSPFSTGWAPIVDYLSNYPPKGRWSNPPPRRSKILRNQPEYYLPLVVALVLEFLFAQLGAVAGIALLVLLASFTAYIVISQGLRSHTVLLGILHWGWLNVFYFYWLMWVDTPYLPATHIIFTLGAILMTGCYYVASTRNPSYSYGCPVA
jgi:hypothetical protein